MTDDDRIRRLEEKVDDLELEVVDLEADQADLHQAKLHLARVEDVLDDHDIPSKAKDHEGYEVTLTTAQRVELLAARVSQPSCEVDERIFDDGRAEGQADVAARLRLLLDPEDKEKLNLEGLLSKLTHIVHAHRLNSATLDLDTLLRNLFGGRGPTTTH